MAVCPRCGVPFSYADLHVCEGRDKTKLWSLAAVGLGAILGGPLASRTPISFCDKRVSGLMRPISAA